tara:strand:+ start:29 stop:397 length:369 start_codon:yes stop_codon:yes gene_type:complete
MTEEVMEEAQRTKEYGYVHPRPDDYNEVYDDDGYIEDYPEEDGDDEEAQRTKEYNGRYPTNITNWEIVNAMQESAKVTSDDTWETILKVDPLYILDKELVKQRNKKMHEEYKNKLKNGDGEE